jgi:hypothetical protein
VSRALSRSLSLAAALVALSSSLAAAGPLADALARHGGTDLAALRARRDDVAARCTLGAIYARRGDLPRAALYLAGCVQAELPGDIATAVRATARDVAHRLDASRLSAIDVMTSPEGLVAEIDALPGESFTTPAKIWVAPGVHVVRAIRGDRSWDRQVTAEPHKDTSVVIETGLDTRPPPAAPPSHAIDFADGSPGDPGDALERHAGPPPNIQHPSMMKDRYRGIPDAAAEGPIADPLAPRAPPATQRAMWLGARLGAGMFDDSAAAARAGLALALAGRYRLGDAAFAAGRADWSRRGGEVMTGTIDVLGASAGVGVTVIGGAAHPGSDLAVAVIAQLRGDLRLTGAREAAPVHRAGLGIAAGAELALPATPFTVGLRFEQGVTELVPGARDRAVLAEVGIDLR